MRLERSVAHGAIMLSVSRRYKYVENNAFSFSENGLVLLVCFSPFRSLPLVTGVYRGQSNGHKGTRITLVLFQM